MTPTALLPTTVIERAIVETRIARDAAQRRLESLTRLLAERRSEDEPPQVDQGTQAILDEARAVEVPGTTVKHGTESGYTYHRRQTADFSREVCDPCRDAHNEHAREYNRRKAEQAKQATYADLVTRIRAAAKKAA